MCAVSNIGDDWRKNIWPGVKPSQWPDDVPPFDGIRPVIPVDRQEFDKLRKEMEELKKLLLAAKQYDEATGQKDCEMGEKVELIKRIAAIVGVSLENIFNNKKV